MHDVRQYEALEVEVIRFESTDVIVTSSNETPVIEDPSESGHYLF